MGSISVSIYRMFLVGISSIPPGSARSSPSSADRIGGQRHAPERPMASSGVQGIRGGPAEEHLCRRGSISSRAGGREYLRPAYDRGHFIHGGNVATWFLDTDYDGKTFHICQAFFPVDSKAWEKLQRALKATIPKEIFEQMRGTVSFPFRPGEHGRIGEKVIDFRGNEVVRVVSALIVRVGGKHG